MLYNKLKYQTLIVTPLFLKSMSIADVNKLILFDIPDDQRDVMRIISKIPKIEGVQKECHMFSSVSKINDSKVLEYLSYTTEISV
jgi:hypothetical protein